MAEADPGATLAAMEKRLRALEDREAIRELVCRYNAVMDNREIDNAPDLFTADAEVSSHDGALSSVGRDAVVEMYQDRWRVLGPSLHWGHDHRIFIDPADPDRATGQVGLHAEMSRFGVAAMSAIRYDDEYLREADGRWRFKSRRLSFFYFMDPREFAAVMESDLRVRSGEEAVAAGFPETLDSWRDYYGRFPRPGPADAR
ncbi:MAG: nuclear transport factor 2 family protein [Actinobacteria bacterium]|nr:nuclear transport factor 2 family protein [Actinomycetota bacterium]